MTKKLALFQAVGSVAWIGSAIANPKAFALNYHDAGKSSKLRRLEDGDLGYSLGKKKNKVFLFFFPFIFISWRLITVQYCSGFCHTLTWISHGFTCVPHPEPPPTSLSIPSLWVWENSIEKNVLKLSFKINWSSTKCPRPLHLGKARKLMCICSHLLCSTVNFKKKMNSDKKELVLRKERRRNRVEFLKLSTTDILCPTYCCCCCGELSLTL